MHPDMSLKTFLRGWPEATLKGALTRLEQVSDGFVAMNFR